ncbi:glycoside hydrolase family 35 protein [Marasmius fiardii PR-910]|nr:glycoside hydrolase family 35 protein [Marasmius fiardii PR-910]
MLSPSAELGLGGGINVDVLARAQAFTDQVRFDNYSLFVKDQRFFLHSGEFHTFRLPVPDLWPDILQKFKAAGLSSVSVYIHMGLTNPSRNVVDFDGYRDLQPLYKAAKDAGITVYINAETTAGGIAHWITSEVAGTLRTNASDWRDAWQAYVNGIIRESGPNQITEGGPLIAIQVDNEYNQQAGGTYFAELEAVYRAPSSGIVVPLTYNDPGQGRNFINGTGAVDLYGLDSYPQGFDCSHPDVWRPVTLNYHQYHASANPSQVWYIPEFQGGAFDAWGPTSPGYENCRQLTGPEFVSVFNLQLWASNAKMINYYMTYGGTSWGAIPFHGVYTSYDYGAAITESRMLTTKYSALKRQGIFLRSSREFYKTDWIGDTSTGLRDGAVISVNNTPAAFVTLLRNPDSKAGFWVVRQNDSTSTATSVFKLNVTTADGSKIQIPTAVTLSGRQSKVIVTDYAFGAKSRALYSTAQVFFAGTIDGRDILFLYGDSKQEHVAAIQFTGTPTSGVLSPGSSQIKFTGTEAGANANGNATIIDFFPGIQGLVTIYDSDTQLILFADTATVDTFWAPTIAGTGDLANFWSLGTNQTVLVGGPYLVRSASISGDQLALRGDLNISDGAGDVMLTVIAPKGINRVSWNLADVSLSTSFLPTSWISGTIPRNDSGLDASTSSLNGRITLPNLNQWKFKDSLPEIVAGFDDSKWAVANHTRTNIPQKPHYGDGRILYGCDYGFCENVVLWRGHFTGTGNEKSVNLSINGGEAFAASVWLNNVFLNTAFGNSTNNRNFIEETDQVYTFPSGAVQAGKDNVITIVQDNMGLDEDNTEKSPRGVRGFQLNTGKFGAWKVQGKVGGYTNFPDKVRGVLNEGGLFGERQGWHLPGFDTSSWPTVSSLSLSAPGVGFFVNTFNLSVAQGQDVMLSLNFVESDGQPYRALLFVNGWMMGKRVGNLGPQTKFPIHEGILDYQGSNTVAVAIWSMTKQTVTPQLRFEMDGVFEGGVGTIRKNNPRWSAQGRV